MGFHYRIAFNVEFSLKESAISSFSVLLLLNLSTRLGGSFFAPSIGAYLSVKAPLRAVHSEQSPIATGPQALEPPG